jgi:hypothetical protein
MNGQKSPHFINQLARRAQQAQRQEKSSTGVFHMTYSNQYEIKTWILSAPRGYETLHNVPN